MNSQITDTRIWLVEDNDSYRKAMARSLGRSEGILCERECRSAEELIAALKMRNAPDVILLDVQLPGNDGISCLPVIKSLAPGSRVMVLTAFDDSDKIYNAICAGASGYLLKSATAAEILAAISEVLSGGAPMTSSLAVRVLQQFSDLLNPNKSSTDYKLTEREVEILSLMADGLVKKEIGDKLAISLHTVNSHIRRIYDKLQVNTNTAAVAKAIREDIV
ncbi:MAG: response regulator transcription factor [Verrucomicrobiota bacterium]